MAEIVDFERLSRTVEVGHAGDVSVLSDALNEALRKVATAAFASGAKAKMQLVITMKPAARGELEITTEIKTSLPEPKAFAIRVYQDRRGQLVLDDPEQGRLDLGVVPTVGERA